VLGHPFPSPMEIISSVLIADESSVERLMTKFKPPHYKMKNRIVPTKGYS